LSRWSWPQGERSDGTTRDPRLGPEGPFMQGARPSGNPRQVRSRRPGRHMGREFSRSHVGGVPLRHAGRRHDVGRLHGGEAREHLVGSSPGRSPARDWPGPTPAPLACGPRWPHLGGWALQAPVEDRRRRTHCSGRVGNRSPGRRSPGTSRTAAPPRRSGVDGALRPSA
jgi:hypothetical protein